MATVTNWIDHLTATAGADSVPVYPFVGTEGIMVIALLVIWIGWTVITAASEQEEQDKLARKRHGANDHKSNITDW